MRPPIDVANFSALRADDADSLHVKFADGLDISVSGGRIRGLDPAPDAVVVAALEAAGATVAPLFGRAPAQLDAEREAFEIETGAPQVDLTLWVRIDVGIVGAAPELLDTLNAAASVEAALPEPQVAPASFVPSLPAQASPDFEVNQLYLGPAPGGIDADYAATVPGGTGSATVITDVEYSWDTGHEDLADSVGTEIANGIPLDPFNVDHGTAVLGIIAAENNGFGVTGIVPDAGIQLVNAFTTSGQALTNAINIAAANSDVGDVVLLEQQLCAAQPAGSHCPLGWLPVEWFPSYYDAIVAAVGAGVHVVEAAGNGGRDIDSQLIFDDSGAVLVGAGNAAGCIVFGVEPPGGRLDFSNYGQRIDVQSHGGCVWSTGGEGGGTNANLSISYTGNFSGTSSAAAIVAGAVASLASVSEVNGDALAPNELRALLRATGVAQDTTLDERRIGPQPDLQAAISSYLATPHPAPANDDFLAPTVVASIPTTIDQSTAGASVQVGEPASLCGFPDRTVWFEHTPTRDTAVTFRASGSGTNPSIAVWIRSAPDLLTQIDCAFSGQGVVPHPVEAELVAGETYYIQVGDTGDDVGLQAVESIACDLDDDGYGDVLIGVPEESVKGRAGAGAINVYYGHPDGDPDVAPMLTAATAGVASAAEPGDQLGYSLACGDINGDGYDDALVGSPGESKDSKTRSGAVHVFYGSPAGISGADDTHISQATGSVPGSAEAFDEFGSAVALGDFNGDGFADAAIGSPGEGLLKRRSAGMVTILFGSAQGLDLSGGMVIHQNKVGVPGAIERNDGLGNALAVGDITGDGYDDLAIGVSGESLSGLGQVGAVVVISGSVTGPDTRTARWIAPTQATVATAPAQGLRFGSVVEFGELTGDGFLDLVIGGSVAIGGTVDVMPGSGAGIGTVRGVVLSQGTGGVPGTESPSDLFGGAMALGDLDLDGIDELYVGAPGKSDRGFDEAGRIFVIGFDASLAVTNAALYGQSTPGLSGAPEPFDGLGRGLAVEDLGGDGYPDLLVGASGESVGGDLGAGMFVLLPGSASGIDLTRDRALHQGSRGIGGSPEPADGFAFAFS
jgi:serine protease